MGVGRGGVLEAHFWGSDADVERNFTRYRETLAVVQQGLSHEELTFKGDCFAFDGLPPGEAGLETYTFTEAEGQTTLVAVGHFTSIESRDAAIQSGMEKGAAETWDRLAELLRTLK